MVNLVFFPRLLIMPLSTSDAARPYPEHLPGTAAISIPLTFLAWYFYVMIILFFRLLYSDCSSENRLHHGDESVDLKCGCLPDYLLAG